MLPTRKGNVEGQVRKKERMPVADRLSSSPWDSEQRIQSQKNYNPAGESLQGKT
jgi:hypothetical protein